MPESFESPRPTCRVCGYAANAVICKPCKAFYRRYRNTNGESLRCLSETKACAVDFVSRKAVGLTANGVLARVICPKCRYLKCLAEDIDKHCRNSSIKNSYATLAHQNGTVMVNCTVQNKECVIAENTLQEMIWAMFHLSAAHGTLPLMVSYQQFSSDIEAFQALTENIRNSIEMVSDFVKTLTGHGDLSEQEHFALTVKSAMPIALVDSNRITQSPFVMNSTNADQFTSLIPELLPVRHHTEQLWSMLSKWNPAVSEFACLLGQIVLNSYHSLPKAGSCVRNLELAIEATLLQNYGSDPLVLDAKKNHLIMVANFAIESVNIRNTATCKMLIWRPHITKIMPPVYDSFHRICLQKPSNETLEKLVI